MRISPNSLPFSVFMMLTAASFASSTRPVIGVVPDGGTGPGFVEAVFEPGVLQGLLGQLGCTGVRFYNAMLDSAAQGTVIAIGIRADGSEIVEETVPSAYVASNGITLTEMRTNDSSWMAMRINSRAYGRNEAGAACDRLRAAGFASFSATFTAAGINDLLTVRDCTGLRVAPAEHNGKFTMSISAVRVVDGRMVALGRGTGFERACTDPCPTVCGPPANYINLR